MAHRTFTAVEIERALRATKGMVALAASRLGMARGALYVRINKSEALKAVLADERETMTDTAELSLHRAIVRGEAWAVCFYLKTQGKRRGYVERSEIEVVDAAGFDPAAFLRAGRERLRIIERDGDAATGT